jgi:hypothetical protein
MTKRPHETDGGESDDRILSDFSTEPETAGYGHATWAATILIVGALFGGLPLLLPWYIGLPLAVVSVALLGIAFSAAPPHLSPLAFIRHRFNHWTSQQVFISSGKTRTRRRLHRQQAPAEQTDADSENESRNP